MNRLIKSTRPFFFMSLQTQRDEEATIIILKNLYCYTLKKKKKKKVAISSEIKLPQIHPFE